MKTIKLTVLFLFFPLVFFAQTLTGLWIGTVHNDSTTIRKDQSFEIVLTQYKDKVYGYSRSTFIVNDSLFYIVKRVKGTIEGDICEVKDDDIVSYNFKGRLDKGVKMVSAFRFDHQDSVWRMDGDWKTNKTKKYYSVSGKIALAQEKDLEKSKIFPHLEELKLADEIAFYKESKKASEPVAAVKDKAREQPFKEEKPAVIPIKETKTGTVAQTKPTEIKGKPAAVDIKENKKDNVAIAQTKSEPVAEIKQPQITNQKETNDKEKSIVTAIKETKSEPIAQTKPTEIKGKPAAVDVKENKKDNVVITQTKSEPIAQTKPPISNTRKEQPATEEKKIAVAVNTKKDSAVIVQAKSNPVIQTSQPVNEAKKQLAVKEEKQEPKKSEPIVITKPPEQKREPIIESAKPEIKNKEITSVPAINNKPQPVSIFSDSKPVISTNAAVFVADRKVSPPQIVNYKSDSLELALYDNGEVDGDTVSVLLNGEIILAKQGLKASAIKKTIYVPAGKDDSLTLVLYAENLGKYPPNTGLLIVHDGDDTYQIRFSADLQQNAAVIFKRKRN